MANVIGYREKNVSLKKYIEQKIDMLEDEFLIQMSYLEKEHMASLTTYHQVDQYANDILRKGLGGE